MGLKRTIKTCFSSTKDDTKCVLVIPIIVDSFWLKARVDLSRCFSTLIPFYESEARALFGSMPGLQLLSLAPYVAIGASFSSFQSHSRHQGFLHKPRNTCCCYFHSTTCWQGVRNSNCHGAIGVFSATICNAPTRAVCVRGVCGLSMLRTGTSSSCTAPPCPANVGRHPPSASCTISRYQWIVFASRALSRRKCVP